MRTRTKVAIALTLAVLALAVTAIVAAAGSADHPVSSSGGSSGHIPVDPPVSVPCAQEKAGPEPADSVSHPPCQGVGSPFPSPTRTDLVPTPGMDGVHARIWDSATVGNDGRTVTLDFSIGVAPCSVLDHIDVAYGSTTVTITLYEGSDPSAKDVACIDIAMLASTTVHLDQPLGDRRIVDGALG